MVYATDSCLAAASGDLAATWGRVEDQGKVRGYYMRAWRRDDQGRWRIAVDASTELPAK